jgi:PAS domain S-box-containing protein
MSELQNFQILEQLLNPNAENTSVAEQLRQILDLVEAFVAVINVSGDIVLINRKGKEILGYQDDELIGKNFKEFLVAENHQENTDSFYKALWRGDVDQHDYHQIHLYKSNHEPCIVEILYSTISDSRKNLVGVLISGSDISNQNQSNRRLYRSKEKAEQFNRTKSDFLSRVSHEIRTPLNAIMGFTEQLRQTELDEQQSEFVKVIDKSSEHMLSC